MNLAKKNTVLLVTALVLAVPTAIQLYVDAESFVDLRRVPLLFDGFTAENVGSVAIGQPKKEQPAPNQQNPQQKQPIQYDQVVVVRTDKGWSLAQPTQAPGAPPFDLAGAPVQRDKLENDVFSHLRKIRNDRESRVRAAATPEQLEEYGLDEKQAMLIKVSDRNNQAIVAELYVGKEAGAMFTGSEGVQGRFVRRPDSSDVLLYEYDKAFFLSVQPEQWLERSLLQLDPTQVQRISLRNSNSGGQPVVVRKADGKASWICDQPPAGRGAVRQTEIEAFAQRLRYLNVQDYRLPLQRAGNLAALGLQPPQLELEVDYYDGELLRTAKFAVGNQVDGKNEHYLTSSETTFLMTWPAGLVTGLDIDLAASWFDPAAPAAEAKPGDGNKPADDGK